MIVNESTDTVVTFLGPKALAAITPDERAAYKARPMPPLAPLDLA